MMNVSDLIAAALGGAQGKAGTIATVASIVSVAACALAVGVLLLL